MLDLTANRTESKGTLAKLSVKRAGTGSGDALSLSVDVAFEVEDRSEAEIVDMVVPGARALFIRKESGAEDRAKLSRSPSGLSVLLSLRKGEADEASEDGDIVAGFAEVLSMTFAIGPKFSTFTVRFRFSSDASIVSDLSAILERPIRVGARTAQTVLPFRRRDEVAVEEVEENTEEIDPSEIETFDLATFEDGRDGYSYGRVVAETSSSVSVSDFDGVLRDVSLDLVASRITVSASGEVLSEYVEKLSLIHI